METVIFMSEQFLYKTQILASIKYLLREETLVFVEPEVLKMGWKNYMDHQHATNQVQECLSIILAVGSRKAP